MAQKETDRKKVPQIIYHQLLYFYFYLSFFYFFHLFIYLFIYLFIFLLYYYLIIYFISLFFILPSFRQIFGASLKDTLEPKLPWLAARLRTDKQRIADIVKKYPQILMYSIERNLAPTIDFFEFEMGEVQASVHNLLKATQGFLSAAKLLIPSQEQPTLPLCSGFWDFVAVRLSIKLAIKKIYLVAERSEMTFTAAMLYRLVFILYR